MIVQYPTHDINKTCWNDFCLRSELAWFWHTTHFLDYLAVEADNYSFAYVENNRIEGIVPMVFRNGKEVDGYPLPRPIYSTGPPVMTETFSYALSSVYRYNIRQWRTRESPLARTEKWQDALTKEGVEFKLHHSVVIDLTRSPSERWAQVRKSYHSLINKADLDRRWHVVETNSPEDWWDCFVLMHHEQRGGSTRPDATWKEMWKWVERGFGRLFGVKDQGKWIGFAFLVCYKNAAYYASGVANQPNVASYLLWHIQELLPKYNIDTFELGWADVGTTEKEKAIEFFKMGMGKDLWPWVSTTLYSVDETKESVND